MVAKPADLAVIRPVSVSTSATVASDVDQLRAAVKGPKLLGATLLSTLKRVVSSTVVEGSSVAYPYFTYLSFLK